MNAIGVGIVLISFAVALFLFGLVASFIGFNAGIFYLLSILLVIIAAYIIKSGTKSTEAQDDVAPVTPKHQLPDFKEFVFYASGVNNYCSERIYDTFLCDGNPEYRLSKREMIDECLIDDKVYSLEPSFGPCRILPDPNNKHDPESLKILKGETQIGFVPDESVGAVKSLLANHPDAEIRCWITGGDYKIINEEYSVEHDKQVYVMESGTDPVSVKVTIRYQEPK